MNFTRHGLLVAFAVVTFPASILAYGPLGHQIVGAIADERLTNTPTAAKVYALLDGLRLEKAALIADEIKGWDKKGSTIHGRFIIPLTATLTNSCVISGARTSQPTIPNSPAPSHHWFHYTDVPVMPAQRYRDGSAGRSKWDVVHMIPFCIDVLQGRIPEQNERRLRNLLPYFACSLRRRYSPAVACRRGIFR